MKKPPGIPLNLDVACLPVPQDLVAGKQSLIQNFVIPTDPKQNLPARAEVECQNNERRTPRIKKNLQKQMN